MNNTMMVLEPSGDHYGSFFVIDRVLYDKTGEFQRVFVFESESLGRVLMLDDIFNVSTKMEAYYHEPMAHIPIAMLKEPKKILLIGGGDFGIAKQILKHTAVEELIMCELDPLVIEACREYFPEWADVENDPRFTLRVGDGCAYIHESAAESFDAVIIDSTDPILHAPMLISQDFYNEVHRTLTSSGVCMQIIADHILYPEAWETVVPRIQNTFAEYKPMFLPIPFYATGAWGLMIASKSEGIVQPQKCSSTFLQNISQLKTLTPERIQGWFSLTPELQAFFKAITNT